MNIESNGFTIQMDSAELWELASNVKESLLSTMSSHWVNHPDNWVENEQSRLKMLKTMYSHMGRLDMYEDAFKTAENILKDHKTK